MSNYDKRFFMAILIILGVFGYIFFKDAYNDLILGALLTTGFSSIVGFFFGSSDRKGKDGDK